MQFERYRDQSAAGDESAQPLAGATQTCAGCRAVMPAEMRFCRSCGYRLGEGVAEYAETIRFNDSVRAPTFAGGQIRTDENLAKSAPQTSTLGDGMVQPIAPVRACARSTNWTLRIVLAVAIFAASGGLFSLNVSNWSSMFDGGGAEQVASASRIGVGNLTDADNNGGALIDVVTPPGSPLDRVGLVGGDAIMMFDGQPTQSASELRQILANTPIGKTVEIVYTRDGETRRATATTVSGDEIERLEELYDDRPEEKGFLGISRFNRVPVPGTNIHGAQIRVTSNRPAHIAGLLTGDIIIEFGGVPIRTERELVARIERAIPLSEVRVVVIRDGERLEIPVRMGED